MLRTCLKFRFLYSVVWDFALTSDSPSRIESGSLLLILSDILRLKKQEGDILVHKTSSLAYMSAITIGKEKLRKKALFIARENSNAREGQPGKQCKDLE